MASKAITLTAGVMTPDSDLPTEIAGIVQATAGSVVIWDNATAASGTVVLASGGIGTVSLNEPVKVQHGMFVVLTGGATGSVLTA